MTTKCPDCGKMISTRFPMHDCKPKNPAAVALGKLGGRPKGCPGRKLDPDKARQMGRISQANRRAKKLTAKQWMFKKSTTP